MPIRPRLCRAAAIFLLLPLMMLAAAPAAAQSDGIKGDGLVAEIQRGLKRLGYDIAVVDGLYGPNTAAAIEAFESDQGAPVTGEATVDLRERIVRVIFQRSRDAGRMWRRSRLYLRALGYAPGDDGFDSPAARRALERFATEHFLEIAPTFSEALHEVIVRRARAAAGAQDYLCDRFMRWKDYARAIEWCLRRARRDDVDAQYYVGWMYYYGRGVEQSYAEAAPWYRRAARAGDSRAQTFLGLMYRYGHGVPQDPQAAQRWYSRAAEE